VYPAAVVKKKKKKDMMIVDTGMTDENEECWANLT
jgi:hypothetical protein